MIALHFGHRSTSIYSAPHAECVKCQALTSIEEFLYNVKTGTLLPLYMSFAILASKIEVGYQISKHFGAFFVDVNLL